MLKTVIDTNIIVSALLTENGKPAQILDLFQSGKIELFYSEEIFTEYNNVLFRPFFKFDKTNLQKIIDDIQKFGKLVFPLPDSLMMPDESDRTFYATAKQTGSYLITGNKKHFPNKPFILSPADFLTKYISAL